jgi:hypothetical protein
MSSTTTRTSRLVPVRSSNGRGSPRPRSDCRHRGRGSSRGAPAFHWRRSCIACGRQNVRALLPRATTCGPVKVVDHASDTAITDRGRRPACRWAVVSRRAGQGLRQRWLPLGTGLLRGRGLRSRAGLLSFCARLLHRCPDSQWWLGPRCGIRQFFHGRSVPRFQSPRDSAPSVTLLGHRPGTHPRFLRDPKDSRHQPQLLPQLPAPTGQRPGRPVTLREARPRRPPCLWS